MSHDLPRYFCRDRLAVEVHADRAALGRAAARATAAYLHDTLARRGKARVIFACAPSQNEFLAALVDPRQSGFAIDWTRIEAFHMDEYVGVTADAPQSFRAYLREHLLRHIQPAAFHPIPAEDPDSGRVAAAYAAALRHGPIDLICLGIGENGHLAFNDPPVAQFDDPVDAKIVELDHACRQQQVNDGCFATLDQVPRHAVTLTLPVFRRARRLSVHVPGVRKAQAVRATLEEPVATACPASILRLHPCATLYVDRDSAGLLD